MNVSTHEARPSKIGRKEVERGYTCSDEDRQTDFWTDFTIITWKPL